MMNAFDSWGHRVDTLLSKCISQSSVGIYTFYYPTSISRVQIDSFVELVI